MPTHVPTGCGHRSILAECDMREEITVLVLGTGMRVERTPGGLGDGDTGRKFIAGAWLLQFVRVE